ncbi:hypothetical protein [Sagittula salina]|uniref:Bacteriophage lambda head decoration protein D n=1 Tax=Sagittula salina TaxID=2820268 RepID=A0A940S2C5_9RHOB|nr:hypothetical protein [Sagittula salina]MBP0483947.1 hypothetical protein [Sagittula salina]
MSALTQDRNTPRAEGDVRRGTVAAAVKIFAGAYLMRNSAGHLVPGQTATGLVGVGRAEEQVDNSGGAAGEKTCTYRPGVFRYANSAGGDEITAADIGAKAFAVDDQTVAKTDGTGTRSPAGVVDDVDAQGVWVRFDAALTNAS